VIPRGDETRYACLAAPERGLFGLATGDKGGPAARAAGARFLSGVERELQSTEVAAGTQPTVDMGALSYLRFARAVQEGLSGGAEGGQCLNSAVVLWDGAFLQVHVQGLLPCWIYRYGGILQVAPGPTGPPQGRSHQEACPMDEERLTDNGSLYSVPWLPQSLVIIGSVGLDTHLPTPQIVRTLERNLSTQEMAESLCHATARKPGSGETTAIVVEAPAVHGLGMEG
jgi:hypothetical protein